MHNVAKLELIVITTYCVIVQCFSKCPDACASCAGNTCYSCEDGYFLYNGNCPQCPSTCRICQSQDICTDCQPNYWNLTSHCNKQCPSNCYSNCNRDTGRCFSCKSDFYGYDCEQDCTLCRYGNCNNQGCTSGCYEGYFQDNYQGYSVCIPCSSNCSKCGTFYNCTECQPYFYLYKYDQFNERRSECKQCSPGCAICTDVDRCLSCEHIKYCKECQYNGISYTCSVCENGYTIFGGQCFAEKQCPFGCLSGCDIRGVCSECKPGFTGNFCNNSCSDVCLRCSKESSNICEQCKYADLFTQTCTEHCNENCLKIAGNSTCRLENGDCLHGCKGGSWGTKCENNCSINCMQNANSQPFCSMLTGSCTYGCMAGFTGPTCDSRITATALDNSSVITTKSMWHDGTNQSVRQHQSHPQEAKSSTNTANGAGIGGGVAVVIIITVIITVILLKRRMQKKPQFRSHVYENADIDISHHDDNQASPTEMIVPSSETSMYEHLSSRQKENHYSVLSK